MALAISLRKVASKILRTFGGEVTVRFVTPGGYDTSTGIAGPATEDNARSVRGIVDTVNSYEVGGLIRVGDRKLTVAAADLKDPMGERAPTVSDRVAINYGDDSCIIYQVVTVNTTEQDNRPIIYELILRH